MNAHRTEGAEAVDRSVVSGLVRCAVTTGEGQGNTCDQEVRVSRQPYVFCQPVSDCRSCTSRLPVRMRHDDEAAGRARTIARRHKVAPIPVLHGRAAQNLHRRREGRPSAPQGRGVWRGADNAGIGRSARRRGGGEGGIRTRDGLPRTAFPVRRHSPLGDLSPDTSGPAGNVPTGPLRRSWRRGRDSNPRCFRTPLFESGTINHSDTSPRSRIPNLLEATPGCRPLRRSAWRRTAPLPRRGGCRSRP
jgi:hypothetical protein